VGNILCTTTKAPAAFSLNFLSILKVWSLGHQSLLMALPAKIAQDQFPFEILIVESPKWAGKYYRVSNSCMHFSSPSASLKKELDNHVNPLLWYEELKEVADFVPFFHGLSSKVFINIKWYKIMG
jgi:hypothetical protein